MRPDKQARTSVDYDSGISERAWRKITSQVNRGAAAFFERRGMPAYEFGTPQKWNEARIAKIVKLKDAKKEGKRIYDRTRRREDEFVRLHHKTLAKWNYYLKDKREEAMRKYRLKHGIPLDMPKRKPGQYKQWKELLYNETHKTCPPATPTGT